MFRVINPAKLQHLDCVYIVLKLLGSSQIFHGNVLRCLILTLKLKKDPVSHGKYSNENSTLWNGILKCYGPFRLGRIIIHDM